MFQHISGRKYWCNVAQLCILVSLLKEDYFQEELVCLLPLLGRTRGEDVLIAICFVLRKIFYFGPNLHVFALLLPQACKEKKRESLAKWNKEIKYQISSASICIIHQESFASKIRNNTFQNVMQTVVQVANYVVLRALKHRQFRLLINMDFIC